MKTAEVIDWTRPAAMASAVYELYLTTGRCGGFEFSLPASIRVMQIRGWTFIATGLVLHQTGRIELSDYSVHELYRDRVRRVCNKF